MEASCMERSDDQHVSLAAHRKMTLLDSFVAGDAGLASTCPAPHVSQGELRQASIGHPGADESADLLVFHRGTDAGLGFPARRGKARFTMAEASRETPNPRVRVQAPAV